jgi:hypothetical protein
VDFGLARHGVRNSEIYSGSNIFFLLKKSKRKTAESLSSTSNGLLEQPVKLQIKGVYVVEATRFGAYIIEEWTSQPGLEFRL